MTTALPPDLSAALSGRYELERELGGGGMSRVFLARELALGRSVVLKVLPDEMASGVSAERFAREIQLAASLSQANIVPLLAAGDAGGVSFYTMPFVAGDSLRHRMQGGELPAAESIGFCATSPAHSPTRTNAASCTATSNPRTCCSRTVPRSSRISESLKPSPPRVRVLARQRVAARSHKLVPRSARRHT